VGSHNDGFLNKIQNRKSKKIIHFYFYKLIPFYHATLMLSNNSLKFYVIYNGLNLKFFNELLNDTLIT
jgi:hypothetical protein